MIRLKPADGVTPSELAIAIVVTLTLQLLPEYTGQDAAILIDGPLNESDELKVDPIHGPPHFQDMLD
ncbi:unnamed protein product [Adineta steineri]|uniref:Uncharacterized protein n=1 Tax=Adineta steineri TaxID=433720 RepID=A0A819F3G3_9BILA|nr:unnamed protein product [Adineta steineri]CAF3861953.1 unnamed protein product [Adineta steineri]